MSTVRRYRVAQVRPRPEADSTWHETLTAWSATLAAQGKTATTKAGYVKHLGWLAGDVLHICPDPWDLDAATLGTWLENQRWSAATRQRVLTSVRAFYTWGVLNGLCRISPLSGIPVAPPKLRGPKQLDVPAEWTTPLRDFQAWLRAKGQSDGTIDHRRSQLARFAQAHGDPWGVTLADLTRWLSRPDWTPGYKRAVRSALRSFYRWAHIHGHIAQNPARDLDPIRQHRHLPRPTPDDAVWAGLAIADDRVALAIQIALYAGLRRFEIAQLHTRDIGAAGLRVVGKGGHERLVPIHPDLHVILAAELRRRREGHDTGSGWGPRVPPADGWLFPSDDPDAHLTARWLGTLIGRAMPPGWTAHTLRHRFATQAYRSERDLRAVQELLGHAKPESTARYAAVPDGALTRAVAGVGLQSH